MRIHDVVRGRKITVAAGLAAGAFLLAGAAMGAGAAKKSESAAKSKSAPNPVAAAWNGGKLTLQEIQQGIARRNNPYLARRLQSLEGRRQYVQRIVQNRVLAEAARRQGLDKDPEIRARIDAILAVALIQRLRKQQAGAAISEADAEAYFKSHPREFNRPERKRLSQIFLRIPANAKDGVLAKKMATAQKILDELKKAGKKQQVLRFHQLAAKYSEDIYGRRYKGYYGMISPATKPSARFPKEVLEAARSLKTVGDISGIVKASDGIHILLLDGTIPAIHQTFKQALPLIRARLRTRRTMDIKMLAADIFKKADIKINDAVLKQLQVPKVQRRPNPFFRSRLHRPPRVLPVHHSRKKNAGRRGAAGPKPPSAPAAPKKK